jgi:hypothetical protein
VDGEAVSRFQSRCNEMIFVVTSRLVVMAVASFASVFHFERRARRTARSLEALIR